MMNGTWMTHRFFVGAWGTGMLRALPRGAAMDKAPETSLSTMSSAVGMNQVSLTVPTMDSKYITAIMLRTQGLVVQVYEYIPYFPKLNMISKFLWGLIHFVRECNLFVRFVRTCSCIQRMSFGVSFLNLFLVQVINLSEIHD